MILTGCCCVVFGGHICSAKLYSCWYFVAPLLCRCSCPSSLCLFPSWSGINATKRQKSPTQTIGEWHLELHPSPISTSPTEANSSSMTTSLTAIPSEPTPPPAALHTPHHPNSAWVKGELRICWLTRDTWPDETFTLQPGPFPNDAASAALGSGSGKQAAGVEHTQEWHFLGSSTSFGRTMAMSLKTATPIPPHSPPPAADAPLPATAQPPAPESTPVLSPGAAATSSCSTAASHVEHGCAVPPVSLELSLQQREALNIPIDAPSEGYDA